MNSRILKKLCKRAAILLPQIASGIRLDVTSADNDPEEWMWLRRKFDRKHIVKSDRRQRKHQHRHAYITPMDGTVAVVWELGGYEEATEFDDEPAYCTLRHLVADHFTDYRSLSLDDDFKNPTYQGPPMRTPTELFKAAELVITRKALGIKGVGQ